MNDFHCIAVIHARGGSKRLPLKNIRPLLGKPLIAWCIEAALGSKLLDRVIVSTDHDGIADAAIKAGAEVPFRRPADLSEDVPSELVTRHALEFHERDSGRTLDAIVTMQPTTPLIQSKDISACIEAVIRDDRIDSAMTVGPIHERPEWMYRQDPETGTLSNWTGATASGDFGVSQTLEPLVMPNGGAYVSRRNVLYEFDSVIGDNCFGHVMSRERSVDIDDLIDFVVAESIARHLADNPQQ